MQGKPDERGWGGGEGFLQALETLRPSLLCLLKLRLLQAKNDSGLIFASGSHRDFALPFWHHSVLEDMDLSSRGYPVSTAGALCVTQ